MNKYVTVVHSHPLRILKTSHTGRFLVQFLAGHLAYRLRDGFHLSWRIALTNHEITGYSPIDSLQVGHHYMLSFFLLYTFFYCFY